jgi:hypothetical protein
VALSSTACIDLPPSGLAAFRVQPLETTSTYSRSVLGAQRNLATTDARQQHLVERTAATSGKKRVAATARGSKTPDVSPSRGWCSTTPRPRGGLVVEAVKSPGCRARAAIAWVRSGSSRRERAVCPGRSPESTLARASTSGAVIVELRVTRPGFATRRRDAKHAWSPAAFRRTLARSRRTTGTTASAQTDSHPGRASVQLAAQRSPSGAGARRRRRSRG